MLLLDLLKLYLVLEVLALRLQLPNLDSRRLDLRRKVAHLLHQLHGRLVRLVVDDVLGPRACRRQLLVLLLNRLPIFNYVL